MTSVDLAKTVCRRLLGHGVRRVVLAPGSRNAPLSLALATLAEAGLVDLQVRVDERTAGFVALGAAKVSGEVVAVVTTSGTAVGNLLPAVMEARHGGVPLLVLSADRPLSMRDAGANQTTRQLGLLAPHALDCVELASDPDEVAAWGFALDRAVELARGTRTRQPGPVQVNLGFAEPLVDPSLLGLEDLTPDRVRQVTASAPGAALDLTEEARTVVLVGDATPEQGRLARDVAERGGWPLFAEPSSNARVGANAIAGYRLLVDDRDDIERVVVVGHPTLSRPVTRLLRREEPEVVVVASSAEWIDPGQRADRVVDRIGEVVASDPGWLRSWQQADREVDRPEGWGRQVVADRVVAANRAGQVLVLGSSNPIRDADLAPVAAAADEVGQVFANRGLAGIDGTLSTALGVAWVTGEPVTVLLGDLTFQHDLGALVGGELEAAPGVRVVVVDDHGGGIFAGLEQGQAEYAAHFDRVFGTPQRLDVGAAARGLGAEVIEVADEAGLEAALAAGHPDQGWQVIVCRVGRPVG